MTAARAARAGEAPRPRPDRDTQRRSALRVGALLVAAGLLTASWAAQSRAPAPAPAVEAAAAHILFVDTEGWYARTPDEVAVTSPFDLTLDGLPAGLPYTIGHWAGEDRPPDADLDRWLHDPELAVTRTYRRADGATVWLSAYGSRGDASFHLFEHTPLTCYPLSGWAIRGLGKSAIPMGPRPLTLTTGAASGTQGDLAFAFAYIWGAPSRDPALGLVSLRLAAPALPDVPLDAARAALMDDFVHELFGTTLSWSAF